MTDRWCLWTWELHGLWHLDTSWWWNGYERRFELHTLEVLLPSNANSKCGGDMWVSRVSSFRANSYLGLKIVLVLVSCFLKKIYIKIQKNERNCHGDNIEFSSKNTMVSTLSVLLLNLNKALPWGCPRITRFILMLISLRIKLNHASMPLYLFLYALVWMYTAAYIHRPLI